MTPIMVRPSNVGQIREALRPLLDKFEHDFPTDEAWLEDATSRVYNKLASERYGPSEDEGLRRCLERIVKGEPLDDGTDLREWVEWAQTDAYAALMYVAGPPETDGGLDVDRLAAALGEVFDHRGPYTMRQMAEEVIREYGKP